MRVTVSEEVSGLIAVKFALPISKLIKKKAEFA